MSSSKQNKKQLEIFEDDDFFEEFDQEDWDKNQMNINTGSKGTQWEENWEEDYKNDQIDSLIKKEIEKYREKEANKK